MGYAPRAGTTTTAINLAALAATTGKSVLYVAASVRGAVLALHSIRQAIPSEFAALPRARWLEVNPRFHMLAVPPNGLSTVLDVLRQRRAKPIADLVVVDGPIDFNCEDCLMV